LEIRLSTKPPLKSIVDAWHSECAEIRLSDRGTPMPIINPSRMLESLKILAKTLFQNGYSYEEVDSPRVSILIVDKCWKENQIVKMSTVDVRKAKKNLADSWDSIIHSKEFSGIVIAKLEESEKIVAVQKTEYKKEEKLPELDPSDRIKMDTSDLAKPEFDEEILAELAALGTVLEEKYE
jgi:hypothetical protein